jgi:hypothetical protein
MEVGVARLLAIERLHHRLRDARHLVNRPVAEVDDLLWVTRGPGGIDR